MRIGDCGLRNADESCQSSVLSPQLSVLSPQLSVECLAATRRGARENCGLRNWERRRPGARRPEPEALARLTNHEVTLRCTASMEVRKTRARAAHEEQPKPGRERDYPT